MSVEPYSLVLLIILCCCYFILFKLMFGKLILSRVVGLGLELLWVKKGSCDVVVVIVECSRGLICVV